MTSQYWSLVSNIEKGLNFLHKSKFGLCSHLFDLRRLKSSCISFLCAPCTYNVFQSKILIADEDHFYSSWKIVTVFAYSVLIAFNHNVDPILIFFDTKEEGIFSRSIYYSLAQIFRRNYHTLCFICIAFIQLIPCSVRLSYPKKSYE